MTEPKTREMLKGGSNYLDIYIRVLKYILSHYDSIFQNYSILDVNGNYIFAE